MSIFTKKSVDALRADAAANPLRRALGPFNLTTLGIGSIIGTGIFVLTGTAASYGADVVSRTVDTHVGELRRKLEADPAEPRHILTVRKSGYRLQLD